MPQLLRYLAMFLFRVAVQRVAEKLADRAAPPPTAREPRTMQRVNPNRDEFLVVGGFDPQLVPPRARTELYLVTVVQVLASTVFGCGTGGILWLAFDSQWLGAAGLLAGSWFLMNLLQILNAAAAQPFTRTERWRAGFVPIAIVAVASFFVAQPVLVLVAGTRPDGTIDEVRASLVDLRRTSVETRNDLERRELEEQIESFESELAALQDEKARVGSRYGQEYLDMVYKERELQGRIGYADERLAQMERDASTYLDDLVDYEAHLRQSTLFAFRLGYVWARPEIAVPASLFFAGLCCGSLLLRIMLADAMNAYLEARKEQEAHLLGAEELRTLAEVEAHLCDWPTYAPRQAPRALRFAKRSAADQVLAALPRR